MDKHLIRKMMKQKRLSINQETFNCYNRIIFQKLITHPHYQLANMIGTYVSLPDETDTLAFIAEALLEHRVCVPRIDEDMMNFYEIYSLDELQIGKFNVLEPITNKLVQPSDIDLMIVPMLAYDTRLYRVGYGKGYYDKYFSNSFSGYKLGLAFSFQKVERINNNHYDYPLNEIITQ